MRKTGKILALSLFALFAFSACTAPDESNSSGQTVVVPDGYVRYDVNQWNGKTVLGFGGQLDTHIYKGNFGNYDGFSDEELNELYRRAEEMNLQNIRTQIFPEWYERANDNDDYDTFDYDADGVDFDSIEMTQLYTLLDFCEEKNVSVDLSFYGCNSLYSSQDGKIKGSWLGAPFTNHWVTAPKESLEFDGYREYAETVYACLNHLLNVKKYTCVDEFSIYPEPNLSFVTEKGTPSWSGYIRLCKLVDAKLKAEGIRDKIAFSGPAEASTTVVQFGKYLTELDGVLDRGTVSTYRYPETEPNKTFYDYGSAMNEMCETTGVPFGLAEFGSKNTYENDNEYYVHMDSFDRALFMARYMINLVNAGATNMKVWTLNDVNYGGYVMAMGLWKFRDEDWKARPSYYSWSLITKYTDKGAEIYPIATEDENLCMVAFKLPDGSWSYMIANDSNEAKKISVVNPLSDEEMKYYLVSENTIPQNREVKPVAATASVAKNEGAYNVEIPAYSFVVLSDKE